MFQGLLFLLLILLLINIVPEAASADYPLSEGAAFALGIGCYAILLALIAWQNVQLGKRAGGRALPMLYLLTHIELFAFFIVYHFVLGAERLYFDPKSPYGFQLVLAAVSLGFYFFALYIHYLTEPRRLLGKTPPRAAFSSLRFILPFVIPFLVLDALFDIVMLIGSHLEGPATTLAEVGVAIGGLGCLVLLALFFPYLMQKAWGCKPIPPGPTLERLKALCARVKFRHAGLLTWPAMQTAHTAGIVGILPRVRYVLFTEPLLHHLSSGEVESILAHEMGHSYHRHILLYPCILFGLVVVMTLFSIFIETPLSRVFTLQTLAAPHANWDVWRIGIIYGCYALIILLYIRLIFGLFSRAFEREADLFPLELGLPPHLPMQALDHIASLSGGIHKRPSWHHYSIEQRIHFLQRSAARPALIRSHHRRVRRLLVGYFAILLLLLLIACGPLFPRVPGFASIANAAQEWAFASTASLTRGARSQLAETYLLEHPAMPPSRKGTIEKAFVEPGAGEVEGALEFYASQILMQEGKLAGSAEMLDLAWRLFDFQEDPEAKPVFVAATQALLREAEKQKINIKQENALRRRLALASSLLGLKGFPLGQ